MLVDSHSHIDLAAFDADREEVIARARAVGVLRQVVPAVHRGSWEGLRAVCARCPGLFPAYGLHPMFLAHHQPSDLEALEDWIERESPVAVGECGLDFFVEGLDPAAQRHYFNRQLEIARDAGLPVILHARRALDEVIASLRRVGGLGGVVHSFSGSPEQANALWRLGFCIGIGGAVTHERAQRLRRVVAGMPIEQLLLETDAPDQPDAAWRGRRNEPARLAEILSVVARIRGEDETHVSSATTVNAERVFRLPAA